MNLYIFNDILNGYSDTICVYAKDLNQCKKLFQQEFKSDDMMLIVNEFIEDEMYHMIPVLYDEEPKLITLTPEMEKLVSYTLFHHIVD